MWGGRGSIRVDRTVSARRHVEGGAPASIMEGSTRLTRFEVARVVGMRSLELSERGNPNVIVEDKVLREDTMYVAALELRAGRLRAQIAREDGKVIDVTQASLPRCLDIMLDARDGGTRSCQEVVPSTRSGDACPQSVRSVPSSTGARSS